MAPSDGPRRVRSCAACKKTEGKLRRCCAVTYYCGIDCQRAHRKLHRASCENTRQRKTPAGRQVTKEAARTSSSTPTPTEDGYDSFGDESDIDFDTFEIPPEPDCPVCMYPIPVEHKKSTYTTCCGKTICCSCMIDHGTTSIKRGLDVDVWCRCVFCRTPIPEGKEMVRNIKSCVERGDSRAMFSLASAYENGKDGLAVDNSKAVYWYHRAAKLGNADAAHTLGSSYMLGDIVQEDKKKARRLLLKAAKGGSVGSLHQLGYMDFQEGKGECVRYFLAAVAGGWEDSVKVLKQFHEKGIVSEEEYNDALKSFNAIRSLELSESRAKKESRLL